MQTLLFQLQSKFLKSNGSIIFMGCLMQHKYDSNRKSTCLTGSLHVIRKFLPHAIQNETLPQSVTQHAAKLFKKVDSHYSEDLRVSH